MASRRERLACRRCGWSKQGCRRRTQPLSTGLRQEAGEGEASLDILFSTPSSAHTPYSVLHTRYLPQATAQTTLKSGECRSSPLAGTHQIRVLSISRSPIRSTSWPSYSACDDISSPPPDVRSQPTLVAGLPANRGATSETWLFVREPPRNPWAPTRQRAEQCESSNRLRGLSLWGKVAVATP